MSPYCSGNNCRAITTVIINWRSCTPKLSVALQTRLCMVFRFKSDVGLTHHLNIFIGTYFNHSRANSTTKSFFPSNSKLWNRSYPHFRGSNPDKWVMSKRSWLFVGQPALALNQICRHNTPNHWLGEKNICGPGCLRP